MTNKKAVAMLLAPVILYGIGFLYLQSSGILKTSDVPPGRDEMLYRRGRAIYQSQCTACHNSNPDYAGSVGPALRGVSEELLVDRLTNGKGAMPAKKHLVKHVPALREYLR